MLIFVFWCYCDAERKEKSSSYTTRNKMLMWWRTEELKRRSAQISVSKGSWDAAICDATSWRFSSRSCDEHSGLYFVLLGELATPKEWANWSGRLAQWLAILSYTYRTAAPSRDRYRKYFMPPQDIWMVVRHLPENNKLLLFILSVKKDSVFIVLFMEWF